MGQSFGPVIGPDLLRGEGEGGCEGRQGKDSLFHHHDANIHNQCRETEFFRIFIGLMTF